MEEEEEVELELDRSRWVKSNGLVSCREDMWGDQVCPVCINVSIKVPALNNKQSNDSEERRGRGKGKGKRSYNQHPKTEQHQARLRKVQ